MGGGIGSTSMLLANAFSRPRGSQLRSPLSSPGNNEENDDGTDLGLQFVIQDREVVVEMGLKVISRFPCSVRVLKDFIRHGAHGVLSSSIPE